MLVLGRHPVLAALHQGTVQRLYLLRGARGIEAIVEASGGVPIQWLDRRALDQRAGAGNHQGVVAETASFSYTPFAELAGDLLLALDQIQDPRNLGAIMRSAQAFGAGGIFFPDRRSCQVTPATLKAAAGAVVPVAQVTNLRQSLDALLGQGYWVVGAAADGDRVVAEADLVRKTVLVIGGEGKGLRPRVRAGCDLIVRIPMAGGVGSLNAAAACSILLYEVMRQRVVAQGNL
jgi:23S rRNA (guanosine2251-2'-O)-methyltransferase